MHSITDTEITADIAARVEGLDWDALGATLDAAGHAVTPTLLGDGECDELAGPFDGGRFRSTIEMGRHRFGEGRYRYFDHPLPARIAALRESFYPHLAEVANRWSQQLRGDNPTFPATHAELLERCRAAGQARPTPLILRYGAGDWNALHRDLYGDVFFPTSERAAQGAHGHYRVGMRHGVSTVTRGERTALGIIFHDAA